MTVLSRLTKLGIAKETTPYTYLAPTYSVPFNSGTKYVDVIAPLRDESYRANDSILQGLNQGPANSEWDVQVNGYADLAGMWFRAIIGSDTITAGVSTTLSTSCTANASSISLVATPTSNSIIQLDTGALLEWVQVGTVTGTGPYVCPITIGGGTGGNTTKFAHASSSAAVTQTTHLFKQNRAFGTVWPTYSFTTDDGTDQLGWTGCMLSDLAIKIDPKGFVTFNPKYIGMPSATQSTFAYAASAVQPIVGWAWTVTNNAVSSTRGLTADFTFKRAVEGIWSSDGLQAPREIFAGALEIDGTYKAIFENDLDINLFKQYSQLPTVHTLTQPILSGGASIALTMSSAGYTTGEKDLSASYIQLTQALSGIANSVDAGVSQVTLKNFVTTAY